MLIAAAAMADAMFVSPALQSAAEALVAKGNAPTVHEIAPLPFGLQVLKGKHAPRVKAEGDNIPFTFPDFKQCDPQWANDYMGTKTVCDVGCLMSSTSDALFGTGIPIPLAGGGYVDSNPGTLNEWLKENGGYDNNSLIEEVVEQIDPTRIDWPEDGMHRTNDLDFATVTKMMTDGRIMIANVNNGGHFVLAVGWSDDADTIIVSDPGYQRYTYSYSKDIVGWRIFDMKRV